MQYKGPVLTQPALELARMAASPKQQRQSYRRAHRGAARGIRERRQQKGYKQRRCGADSDIGCTVDRDRECRPRLSERYQHYQIAGNSEDQPSVAVTRFRKAAQAREGQRKQAKAKWQRIIGEQTEDKHSDCCARYAGDEEKAPS